MGTEGQMLKLFPPVPSTLTVWWVQTNSVAARVNGHCSHVPTIPTVFLRYIEHTADIHRMRGLLWLALCYLVVGL